MDKLSQLSTVTEGKAYFPKTMQQCNQACVDTARELHHQYSLAYYPSNRAKDGTWRNIRVEVLAPRPDSAENLTVRTRSGYYAEKR